MKKFIVKIMRYSGLVFLVREFIQRNRITILLYHNLKPEDAEKSFRFLSRRYNLIGLDDFLQAARSRSPRDLPRKAMIITFDDGHRQNIELLPVFRKYRIPITIFICSEIIGTNRHFWFTFQHPHYPLSTLQTLPHGERLSALEEQDFRLDKEFPHRQALSSGEIERMKDAVNFQSHTCYHTNLPTCGEEEARTEVFGSKRTLEERFGLRIDAISYPNGDYSDRDIALCREEGYTCGITVDYGFNTIHTDLFKLKRLSTNDTDDLNELALRASGIWGFFRSLLRKRQEYG